jgi:sugar phosphate isomerase/epimerase
MDMNETLKTLKERRSCRKYLAKQVDPQALDLILESCPAMKLELDVGWAKFAGADPIALMEKHGDRLELLHFKDIRADASPETRDACFTAVGEGSIPLRAIMAAAARCPIAEHGLIIDQDDSPGDILDDLARGAAAIRDAV